MTLYRRLTLVAEEGRIAKAFYPVFPPDRDAAEVLGLAAARARPRWAGREFDGGGREFEPASAVVARRRLQV